MTKSHATTDEILRSLRGTEKQRQSSRLLNRGVPLECILGCSKGAIKKAAKALGRNQRLAELLWSTSFHEARWLAILIADPKAVSSKVLMQWADELWSWDITDQFARYLAPYVPDPSQIIRHGLESEKLFTSRLAFATIACLVMKEQQSTEAQLEHYLTLIEAGAVDDRHHVRKAVVWALVEIGKVSSEWQESAIVCACELVEGSKAEAWVGRNALKALEQLVSVPQRRRLLASTSATARSQQSKNH